MKIIIYLTITFLVFSGCISQESAKNEKTELSSACSDFDNEHMRANCLANEARATKQIGYCKQIELNEYYARCLSSMAGILDNISICQQINQDAFPEYRDECIKNVAVTRRDMTICNQIKMNSIKTHCITASR